LAPGDLALSPVAPYSESTHVDSQWEVYAGGKQEGAHKFHLTRVAAK
jgi:hypothetical protein